jgi:uracil-DNA glycosylase family 4
MLKPPQCINCPLYSKSNGFSIPDGKGTNGVVIVGEALGYEEYLDGLPFRPRASSGSKLEEAFQLNGYHRDSFLLYNTIQCNPLHDNIETKEAKEGVAFCKVHRDKVIGNYKTSFNKVLLGLGKTPLTTLTGVSGEGKEAITKIRGYVLPTPYGPMVPSLHPSFLRRGNPNLTPFLVSDMKKAVSIANGTYTTYKGGKDYVEPKYQTHPSLDEALSFYYRVKDNQRLILTYDIETPMFGDIEEDEKTVDGAIIPTLIQFSLAKGEGIAFPYLGKYIDIAKDTMALPNIKANHNTWAFDNPILRANGFEIGGKIHDTMWMFKTYYPGLFKDLQNAASLVNFPFPWKHLYGAMLEYYGCFIDETRVSLADGSFKKIGDIVKDKLSVDVRGMDESGKVITTKVIGWRKVFVPNQKWLKIKTEATDQPIYCTPDHKIWANGTWKEAKDIRVGDILKSSGVGCKALLHGTLLGDASVDKRGRFTFTHCLEQREWFDLKWKALNGSWYDVPPREKQWSGGFIDQVNHHRKCEVWVSPTLWRKRFYDENGKKFIPPCDAALAVWYCDDGCLAWSRGITWNPRICCQGFSNPNDVVQWAKDRFGSVSTYYDNRNNGLTIAFTKEAKHKFMEAIARFVPQCMEYKIPEEYQGRYNNWLDLEIPQDTIVASVEDYTPRPGHDSRYCITVDHPTHRFFVMGGLVANCADVDAVQWLIADLPKLMVANNTWNVYKHHVYDLYNGPLLRASKHGIPVSLPKWEALKESFEIRVKVMDDEIQEMIPESLKNCTPKHGYVREPSIVTQIRESYIVKAKEALAKGIKPRNTFRQAVEKITGLVLRHFEYEELDELTGESKQISVDRWCKVVPFTASSVQVIRYLEWKQSTLSTKYEREMYKVPMTTARKGKEARATTGKDELKYIIEKTGDPVLTRVSDLRSYNKMLTNDLPNWKPGADGRVHTTWGFQAPTGQLDSSRPNILNCSKHTDLGQEFRAIIEAEPRYEFSEIDYKTFHVAVMGYVANDPDYIKYSQMDPHSIFGSHVVSDPEIPLIDLRNMSKEEIKSITKKFKAKYAEIRQHVAKPSVLGNQLGLGSMRLWRQNRKYIKSQEQAEELQAILARLFPKVEQAKTFIRELAHRQKYLVNPWGRRQDFYEVFNYTFDKNLMNWRLRNGSDSEKCLAFAVQSCAFGMICEKILECERLGYNQRFNWINTIHDSSQFHRLIRDREDFINLVIPIYTSPCKWLKATACPNGLVVNVDHSIGRNWKAYDEKDNPEGMKEI